MPIKPENKSKYPPNWKDISNYVRFTRAKGRCEVCGIFHHAVGYRDSEGNFIPTKGNIIHDLAGEGKDYPSLEMLSYGKAKELADSNNEHSIFDEKHIVIVLTTAHLDHDPENNELCNLKAMCQKCHNNYDIQHRKQTRRTSQLKGQLTINFE